MPAVAAALRGCGGGGLSASGGLDGYIDGLINESMDALSYVSLRALKELAAFWLVDEV